ncbi:class I SAM-dependent methyltransferase [Candidatus Pelagibacter sp.]|nr:class I SAM-dependent methyltransferase [Candidatus Pelagibacter sp.]
MSQKDIGNKIPIYKLKTGKEIEDYYDEWTVQNKYDKDMVDWKYSGPQETIDLFKKHNYKKDIRILDAGCGTGLVGIELKKNGFTNFDGADFSQKMLDLVPENIYENLFKIDLNQKVNIKDNTYEGITCVGTFTFGHVNPPALDEMVRICKNTSLICFTINIGIYEEYGFDKKIKELEDKNSWKIIEFFKSNYIASKEINAWLALAQVTK